MPSIDPNYPLAAAGVGPTKSVRGAPTGEDFEFAQQLAQLPPYARSLLRIELPVVVTLAHLKHPVNRVLELAPGTILHFNKPCDEPLTLAVGRCDVAVGETVKVGEKFGLRITSMVMPEEHFESVQPHHEEIKEPKNQRTEEPKRS
jgi:flagellar motor switch protein FliN/FliY